MDYEDDDLGTGDFGADDADDVALAESEKNSDSDGFTAFLMAMTDEHSSSESCSDYTE